MPSGPAKGGEKRWTGNGWHPKGASCSMLIDIGASIVLATLFLFVLYEYVKCESPLLAIPRTTILTVATHPFVMTTISHISSHSFMCVCVCVVCANNNGCPQSYIRNKMKRIQPVLLSRRGRWRIAHTHTHKQNAPTRIHFYVLCMAGV